MIKWKKRICTWQPSKDRDWLFESTEGKIVLAVWRWDDFEIKKPPRAVTLSVKGEINLDIPWDHPELFALAEELDFPEPLFDWLAEHAETPEQKRLVEALQEALTCTGVGGGP